MKFHKLLIIAAIGCMAAVFLSGSAQAQLPESINEFCDEVARLADDALDDLDRATRDLEDCFDDFDDCQRRADDAWESRDCIGGFSRCIENASTDQQQACSEFARGFRDAYGDASRKARRQGVEDEFLESSQVQDCINIALDTARVCAGLPEPPPTL